MYISSDARLFTCVKTLSKYHPCSAITLEEQAPSQHYNSLDSCLYSD